MDMTTISDLYETTTLDDIITTTLQYDPEPTPATTNTTTSSTTGLQIPPAAAPLAKSDDYLISIVLPIAVIGILIILAGTIAFILRRRKNRLQVSRNFSREDEVMASFRQKPKGVPVILRHEMFKSTGSLASAIFKGKEKSSSRQARYNEDVEVPMLSTEMTTIPPPPFVKSVHHPNDEPAELASTPMTYTSFRK